MMKTLIIIVLVLAVIGLWREKSALKREKAREKQSSTPSPAVPAKPADFPDVPEPADVFSTAGAEGGIRVVVTSESHRFAEQPKLPWRPAKAQAPGTEVITVDSSKRSQSILGFGGAFTDSACYNFHLMPAEARAKLFNELFHPDQLGLNVHRTCIGSSDYATKLYSFDEGEPDPELKRFSIDHDRQWNLPMMREALAVNPEIFMFSSAWSPPGWMKSSGSMLGGNMKRRWMPAYANYLGRFVKEYAQEGVPIKALTVNNEVDTDQDGYMPACLWPQEYEVDFVRYHLGPGLEAAGLNTQIWMIDHNYNLWGRAVASFEEPLVLKYCHSVAWHGYSGEAANIGKVKAAFPQVDMYWTEGGPDFTDPNYAKDWSRWGKAFTINLRNWCRSITVWNLALDENGSPNIGPFPCGGLVTINSETRAVSYSGQFWALGHFSKYVKRDAVRIDSQSISQDIDHVAFVNPDGSHVLVVTNGGATARDITIRFDKEFADFRLDADSVTTFVW